jgi:hypothetical protein
MVDVDTTEIKVETITPVEAVVTEEVSVPVSVATSVPTVTGSVNLLDWEDHAPAPVPPQAPALRLQDFRPDVMSPQVFQKAWVEGTEVFKGPFCRIAQVPGECAPLERALQAKNVRFVCILIFYLLTIQSHLLIFL